MLGRKEAGGGGRVNGTPWRKWATDDASVIIDVVEEDEEMAERDEDVDALTVNIIKSMAKVASVVSEIGCCT